MGLEEVKNKSRQAVWYLAGLYGALFWRGGANCITRYTEMIGLHFPWKSCRTSAGTTGILYLDILAIQVFCVLWIRPAQLGRSVRFEVSL